jgi:hypothetical protein
LKSAIGRTLVEINSTKATAPMVMSWFEELERLVPGR